jgi:hypothetical protein
MPTNVSVLHAKKSFSHSWFAQAINNPNLITTILFCTVGLTISAVVMFRFPDFGAIIAQYNQF